MPIPPARPRCRRVSCARREPGRRRRTASWTDGATFLADILAKTRGATDRVIARAIAYGSGPALDWLVDDHDLPWTLDTAFRAAYGNSRQRVHGWPCHGAVT